MNFFKRMRNSKDAPVKSYEDFWDWFRKNEKRFFAVVKEKGKVEEDFFNVLSPKLNELKDGFSYLTGMYDDNTAELIITADGAIKNMVFVEELIRSAPEIGGWKFTALKPALATKNVWIEMAGCTFSSANLSFYPNEHPDYPDEIDITVVHNDLTEENRSAITDGTYIFLDNYLGELDFAAAIDNLTVSGKAGVIKELIPIEKLKGYLQWRQTEFTAKYEGTRHDTENDHYAMLEAELENGHPLLALINTDLLQWDGNASHPWILTIEIKYNGEADGMPDDETYDVLDAIEDEILDELKDAEGYLNIGRQTAAGVREIYVACKDFRKPSKVLYTIQRSYSNRLLIEYDIYKDKYWRSFNRFISHL